MRGVSGDDPSVQSISEQLVPTGEVGIGARRITAPADVLYFLVEVVLVRSRINALEKELSLVVLRSLRAVETVGNQAVAIVNEDLLVEQQPENISLAQPLVGGKAEPAAITVGRPLSFSQAQGLLGLGFCSGRRTPACGAFALVSGSDKLRAGVRMKMADSHNGFCVLGFLNARTSLKGKGPEESAIVEFDVRARELGVCTLYHGQNLLHPTLVKRFAVLKLDEWKLPRSVQSRARASHRARILEAELRLAGHAITEGKGGVERNQTLELVKAPRAFHVVDGKYAMAVQALIVPAFDLREGHLAVGAQADSALAANADGLSLIALRMREHDARMRECTAMAVHCLSESGDKFSFD